MTKVTIIIAEDHPTTSSGLQAILARDNRFQILATAQDGSVVTELVRDHRPELLVLDLGLPKVTGLQILEQLKNENASCRVVIFSGQATAHEFNLAKQAGADGLLSKSDDPETILTCFSSVLDGHPFTSPKVLALIEPLANSSLTQREKQVLSLVAAGQSSESIATSLSISEKTVKKHRENLMRKLGVNNVAEATKIAIRMNLISLSH